MLVKEESCDITYNKCNERCRYCRPDVLCLHLIDTSYYVCDVCKKWIDEFKEKPISLDGKHYHKKCIEEENLCSQQ